MTVDITAAELKKRTQWSDDREEEEDKEILFCQTSNRNVINTNRTATIDIDY